jgi:hypothetical protein
MPFADRDPVFCGNCATLKTECQQRLERGQLAVHRVTDRTFSLWPYEGSLDPVGGHGPIPPKGRLSVETQKVDRAGRFSGLNLNGIHALFVSMVRSHIQNRSHGLPSLEIDLRHL